LKSQEIFIIGELPDVYIVKSGINTNDKFLLEGVQNAKDDQKIKYDYQKPADVLAHLKVEAN
jgi:membrane fusion protein (multidrug efflux system)